MTAFLERFLNFRGTTMVTGRFYATGLNSGCHRAIINLIIGWNEYVNNVKPEQFMNIHSSCDRSGRGFMGWLVALPWADSSFLTAIHYLKVPPWTGSSVKALKWFSVSSQTVWDL